MTFRVGDRVVYPHHGAAIIEETETIRGFGDDDGDLDYLVLRTVHGDLRLKVPADRAENIGMRYPIDADDVAEVFEVLSRRDVREAANWSRRFKNHQEKLKSGDVYQVAEVVRNLALREADRGLSTGEKTMYTRARQILVSELAFSLDLTEDEVDERLDATLS